MKLKRITAIALTAMAISSCSEDTESIGSSLTLESDKLEITTGFYDAITRSVAADSVYARNFDCYFGMVKDPEIGAYVLSEFMAQFNVLEKMNMPNRKDIEDVNGGSIVADSCSIALIFDRSMCYGDSLTPIKMTIHELDRPMSDTKTYYTNFFPLEEGFDREDGLEKDFVFCLADLTQKDSIRKLTNYQDVAEIPLNDTYTDKSGTTYNNYGTYILRNYFDHPEYFRNSYMFVNNLCPGFFFEISDGLGVMAKIAEIDMIIYYRFSDGSTERKTSLFLSSTPEVLRTNSIINDAGALQYLIDDTSCTYLKAPAGIFTEVTLPVDDIMQEHAKDSLLSVSVAFQRQNSGYTDINYPLNAPSSVLMVHKDSLNQFFETKTLQNYTSSFLASLSSNAYTFSNIGNMITLMARKKSEGLLSDPNWTANHPNWNKVMLVPVAATTTSDNYGNKTVSSVINEMGLVSTKLVGGEHKPIEMRVIYARFKEE